MDESRLWRKARQLLQGRFVRDAMRVGGGAVAGQLVVLLAMPLVTRLYTPAEFGILAVYTSVVFIAFAVAALRYEVAIPLPTKDGTAAGVVIAATGSVLVVGGVAALAVYLAGDRFVRAVNAPELGPYLWLIPVGIVGGGIYRVLSHWAVRRKAFDVIARTKVSQSVAMVLAQLGFGVAGAGPAGLIVGDIAGRAGGSGALFVRMRRDGRLFKAVSPARVGVAARRYMRFPLYSSGSALLNSAALQVPALLVAGIYGVQVAGYFSLSQRVVSLPSWLVGQAVNQVYLGEAAEMARDRPGRLWELYMKLSTYLSLAGVAIAVGIAALSPWAFPFVFGSEWAEAGTYAQLLVLSFVGQFVVAPVSLTLSILEKQRAQLAWDAGRFLAVVAVFETCRRVDAAPEMAVLAYSAVLLIGYVVLWFMSLASVKRRLRVQR